MRAPSACSWTRTKSEGFTLTADMIEPYLTPRTKLVFINSPSNPSGAVLDRAEFEKIYRLTARARHFPDDRRMLLPLPLRQRAVLDRIAAGREGERGGGRVAFEDLCHDRVAHRVRAGAGAR